MTVRTRPAFSLLELLVTIGLLVLLSAAVGGFIFTLFDRETRTLALAERTHAAGLLLDRLERDLITAVTSTPDGPGFVGTEHGVTVYHRSVLAGSPHAPRGDLQKTTLRFEHRGHRLTLEREGVTIGADNASEQPGANDDASLDSSNDTGPDGFGFEDEETARAEERNLIDHVAEVRFRYHDGRRWRESFTSDNGLPAAVEIAIWFEPAGAGQGDDNADAAFPEDIETDFGTGMPVGPEDMLGMPMDGPGMMGDGDAGHHTTPPDRLRVIAVPDALAPRTASSGSGSSVGGSPASMTGGLP